MSETFFSNDGKLNLICERTACGLLMAGESIPYIVSVLSLITNNSTPEGELEKAVLSWHELYLADGHYKNKNRRNYQQELEDIITFRNSGSITLGDFYADLQLNTKDEKSSMRTALSRIVASGILEKVDGGRTGTYRIVKKEIVKTKFIAKDEREGRKFPIVLPFGLSEMCNIHPKSIIIVAGSKSAGKTSILLNIAKMNQQKHDIDYFNSDMGDEEFTDRMISMGCTCEEDIYFNMYNKSSDFQDLITPERKIFIIDFLEIHDEFYKIGAQIKAIWDKLQNGVAIIGLQMKAGNTMGRGGDFTKEKARLYLSLDYVEALKCTKIRIEEAKSPSAIYGEGIRGWWRHVKIIKGGSKFQSMDNLPLDETGWTGYEEDKAKNVIRGSF